MMKTSWFLLVLLIAAWPDKAASIGDDDEVILRELRDRFKSIRPRVQYGVMYLSPPNAQGGQITYQPSDPQRDPPQSVLYPDIDPDVALTEYRYNFAAASVDVDGRRYGRTIMTPRRPYDVHTENLLLNLVLPRMLRWYLDTNNNQDPTRIYIFTHFLPCERCFQIIQRNSAPGRSLIIGFTDLYHGTRNEDQSTTERRRNQLNNFLLNNNGRLIHLADSQGHCQADGYRNHFNIGKRSVQERTCPVSNRQFIITMDFTSGNAVVHFCGIGSHSNGWIGLYNKASHNNYYKTYAWTYGESCSSKVFKTGLTEGDEVRYFTGKGYSSLAQTSFSWDQCGFDWIQLRKLPNRQKAYLKVSIHNGYIKVHFKSVGYIPNRYDWIAIQAPDHLESKNYWNWQWISKLSGGTWTSSSKIDSALEAGFRVKYIYATRQYNWEDMYDNATPMWTPGCRGTLKN